MSLTADRTITFAGATGSSGSSGTSGANGSSGSSGTSGIDGSSGTSGTSGGGGSSVEYLWIPAAAMIPQFTSGPEANTNEFQTGNSSVRLNITMDGWLFDPIVQESVNLSLRFPNNWDSSTLSGQFYWTVLTGSTGSTGNVQWAIKNVELLTGLTSTGASTTGSVLQNFVTYTGLHITPEISVPVVTGLSTSGILQFNVLRDVANDTLGLDVMLLGANFSYRYL